MLSVALSGLQIAINQYLQLAHNRDELLTPLVGRVVVVHLQGLKLSLYFFFKKQEVELLDKFPGTPDVEISGSLLSLLAMKCSDQKTQGFLGGHINISGNTHTAQRFNELFDRLDIDWEEHLSKIVGDSIAHGLGSFARQTRNWGKETVSTLSQNFTEYVQQEVNYFPSRLEVEDFMSDVDELRSDFDRLQARIAQLQSIGGHE